MRAVPVGANATDPLRAARRDPARLPAGHGRCRPGAGCNGDGGNGPVCLKAFDSLLTHLGENQDVWLGWTDWAATEWNIRRNVRPAPDGEDTLQMRVLLRHMN